MARTAKPVGQASIVQDLQGQLRDCRVEAVRLRMELQELRGRAGKPDPRMRMVEQENRRLREELNEARRVRDELDAGVRRMLERIGGGRW